MSTIERKATGDTFRVTRPMDVDGGMAVRPLGRVREYELVDYADDLARSRLAALGVGDAVRLDLSPTADRDGYVVARVLPGGPPAI